MPESRPQRWRVRSKVWLEDGREVLLSGFRADLLERIDRLGSVSAAGQGWPGPAKSRRKPAMEARKPSSKAPPAGRWTDSKLTTPA